MEKLLFSLLPLIALNFPSTAVGDEKPVIYVPVLPYEFVFEKIGGDLVEVHSIVGSNGDPHSYSPTPKQLVQLSGAELICSGSLGFEGNFFVKIGDGKNAPREMDLLKGLPTLEGHCDHPSHEEGYDGDPSEEEHHHHSHDDLQDPHVWLSISMLKLLAPNVAEEIKKCLPESKAGEIDKNLEAFQVELSTWDKKLKTLLGPAKGTKFYVYHGAFAYFAQDYGLEQVAISIGNRSPTPKDIVNFAKKAEDDEVKLVFSQPQFDQTSAKTLAEAIGGKVAVLDPLEKDIFLNLEKMARAIIGE